MYDKNNIFAKIIRGEIPANKVFEDENILAFHDVNPVAPIHILVIPKGEYLDFDDFIRNASEFEIRNYFTKLVGIAEELGLKENGYRIISNLGAKSGQTIFHFHTHIISGREIKGLAG